MVLPPLHLDDVGERRLRGEHAGLAQRLAGYDGDYTQSSDPRELDPGNEIGLGGVF